MTAVPPTTVDRRATAPESAGATPVIAWMSVVLPAPDGPTTATTSPDFTLKLARSNRVSVPMARLTSRTPRTDELGGLVTRTAPRDREIEAAKARERAARRFA